MSDTGRRRKQAEVELHREAIAALVLRHATTREVLEQLAKRGIEISRATLYRDLKALRTEWAQRAQESIGDVVARELAKLDSLERDAWQEKQFSVVLSIMKRRAQLIGLDEQPSGAAIFDLDAWKRKREQRLEAYSVEEELEEEELERLEAGESE